MDSLRLCVIFNPTAGRHRARRQLEVLQATWGSRAEFRGTLRVGHARELGQQAAQEGFDIVVAAGGDGTAHEVANGVLQAHRPEVCFAVFPLGSANDYVYSLGREFGAGDQQDHPANRVRQVDIGQIRDDQGRSRYFLCCMGLGFTGAISIEARRIPRLRGLLLYGLATLRSLYRLRETPQMTIAFDQEPATVQPTLMLSTLIGHREGSFLMAPDARLADGWFDCVRTGPMSRWQVLRYLPGLAFRGPPTGHPQVEFRRCRQITVSSPTPLAVHTDGEIFCSPEEGVRRLEIELIPLGLRVWFPMER
ncbi:MAG: diacylglycerol/lipid kinase family protein [Planctomycetales bacterium]